MIDPERPLAAHIAGVSGPLQPPTPPVQTAPRSAIGYRVRIVRRREQIPSGHRHSAHAIEANGREIGTALRLKRGTNEAASGQTVPHARSFPTHMIASSKIRRHDEDVAEVYLFQLTVAGAEQQHGLISDRMRRYRRQLRVLILGHRHAVQLDRTADPQIARVLGQRLIRHLNRFLSKASIK